jgi:molybdenum cofactor cytidylyltransferase
MKFGPVPLAEAEGKILGHNVAGEDGRRRLRKGRALTRKDLEVLAELRRTRVYVAELEPGDVEENLAAERVARAAAGKGIRLTRASTGRVNLIVTGCAASTRARESPWPPSIHTPSSDRDRPWGRSR